MQRLRQARFLARLVLAWFALSIGVAVASPLVKPGAMQLVCSGPGLMKLLVASDDGSQPPPSPTLDCPLCAAAGSPPPAMQPLGQPPQQWRHALRPAAAATVASLARAPLPARGPPAAA